MGISHENGSRCEGIVGGEVNEKQWVLDSRRSSAHYQFKSQNQKCHWLENFSLLQIVWRFVCLASRSAQQMWLNWKSVRIRAAVATAVAYLSPAFSKERELWFSNSLSVKQGLLIVSEVIFLPDNWIMSECSTRAHFVPSFERRSNQSIKHHVKWAM